MGKQAKKKEKSASQSENQHRHNRATRYSCSKNRPVVWSRAYDKDGDVYEVVVPRGTQWDWSLTHDAVTLEDGTVKLLLKKPRPNLWEPLDRLMDDWSDNLRGYAEFHGAKISREIIQEGLFRYTVYKEVDDYWASKGTGREVLLTVESHKNLNFGSSRRRRRKKRD